VSAEPDPPTGCGVVAAGVAAGAADDVIAASVDVAGTGVVCAGAAVGVAALDGVDVERAGVGGVAGALPGAADGADRRIDPVARPVPAA
jgi:hypothetical protein